MNCAYPLIVKKACFINKLIFYRIAKLAECVDHEECFACVDIFELYQNALTFLHNSCRR